MASISQPLWPNVGAQQLAPFQTPKCRSKCRSRSYKSTVGGVLEDVFMVISVVGQRINCLNFGSRLHVDPNLQQRMQASFFLVVVLIHKDKTTLCFEHDKTDMFGTHPMKLLNKGFSWIVGAFLSTFQWTKMKSWFLQKPSRWNRQATPTRPSRWRPPWRRPSRHRRDMSGFGGKKRQWMDHGVFLGDAVM